MAEKTKACPYCGEPAFRIIEPSDLCFCVNDECPNNRVGDMTFEQWQNRPIEDKLRAKLNDAIDALEPYYSEEAISLLIGE